MQVARPLSAQQAAIAAIVALRETALAPIAIVLA